MPDTFTTGQLARAAGGARSGITLRAVRYYEEMGLLRPAARGPRGVRLYGRDGLALLRKVKLMQEAGLSLERIGRVLKELQRSPTRGRRKVDAHRHLLVEVRDSLAGRRNELDAMLSRIDGVLAKGRKCASCSSADCRGCPRLEAWTSLGIGEKQPHKDREETS